MTRNKAGGLTLIELLVVVAVIAVLIGILLPALAGARRSAQVARRLANMRTTFIVFEQYAEREGGVYPYHDPDENYRVDPYSPHALFWSSGGPWVLDHLWPALFHDVAPWPEFFSLWVDEDRADYSRPWGLEDLPDNESSWAPGSIHYANSFVASPETWGGRVTEAKIGPTMQWAVVFPSAKALLVSVERADRPKRERLFADGSADTAADDETTTPTDNLLRPGYEPRVYHDTPGGVRGRDR